MNQQTRLEVQGAIQQWIVSFMNQYGIPAFMMEDALNKVLLQIKDQVVADLLVAAQAQASESAEEPPQEEDDD